MARLYAMIVSDTHRTQKTICGNKAIEVNLYYGTTQSSKMFVRIHMTYPKDSLIPDLSVFTYPVKKESKGGEINDEKE